MKSDSHYHSEGPKEIAALIARYRASGLGAKRFAREHGIRPGRLHYWLYQKHRASLGKGLMVLSDERWTQRRVEGGAKRAQSQQSRWMWVACEGLCGYPAEVIYQGGHRRWGIENQAFNELTQSYHLTHCYHHDPTSMLVQMLILIFAFTLFTAFALHSQLVRLGELTRKALAHQLDLALEEDLPWNLWFHSG